MYMYVYITSCPPPLPRAHKHKHTHTHTHTHSVWFTEQPRSVKAHIGQPVALQCKAEGKKPIKYLWLKSSHRQDKKTVIQPHSDSGVLVFDPVSVRDSGYYTCQAEYEGNFISSETVFVQLEQQDNSKRGQVTFT